METTDNATDLVYGVLFRIAAAQDAALNEVEGLGKRYRKNDL